MDSIFRLDARGTLCMNEDAVKLYAPFASLSEKQVRYLVLAYDSANTIFKQQPLPLWTKFACEHVFGHANFKKEEAKPEMVATLEVFCSLVYDENRIMKAKLLKRKTELQDELLTSKGSTLMKSIVESIGMIEKMITDLESKISFSDEEVILASKNGKLSMLEKYQRKMKAQIQ